ncbi:hypothetical protein ACG9XX_14730 [Acinetobacter baumannii]|uniref:hypothetical protein n=1 Tax=Acinetobacter baumannii TaxID=470 RepID=UPI0038914955
MNHSDMNHEHMHMSHHSIDTAMVSGHASTHPETTVSSLWTFSNSIETVLIVLFIGFVILKSDAWKNHKLILSLTAVWFFLSMHPLTDSLARHSVWLHCLQSSLIHHLLPLALFLSIHTQTAQVHAQPQVKTAGLMIINIITFNLMSFVHDKKR